MRRIQSSRGKLHSYLNYKWPKCFQFLLCVWGIPSNKLVKFSKTSTYFMSLRYWQWVNSPNDESQVDERVEDGDDGSAGPQGQAEAAGVVRLEDRALSESVWLGLLQRSGGLARLLPPRHLGRSPFILLSVSQPAGVTGLARQWNVRGKYQF